VEVVDNGGFIEMREFCHIVRFVEFGRIDLVNGIPADFSLLSSSLAMPSIEEFRIHTLPSSHCTKIRLPSSSSTIQPFTKAVAGSFNHTYLFPEKSFSPSIPVSLSESRLASSVLMNEGANVLDVGPTGFELDRRQLGPSPFKVIVVVSDDCDW
jgi:hypothetical protein